MKLWTILTLTAATMALTTVRPLQHHTNAAPRWVQLSASCLPLLRGKRLRVRGSNPDPLGELALGSDAVRIDS